MIVKERQGKPLTEFEHFKAEWENYIKKIDEASAERISRKIDIDWTDVFWPYRGDNNIIDDEFVRYYMFLCNIIFYEKYPYECCPSNIFDATKELFYDKNNDAKSNLLFIEESFDCLKGLVIEDEFNSFLTKELHVEGKSHIDEEIDIFGHCCTSFGERKNLRVRSFSIGRMILLYAFILYWKNKTSITKEQFAKRVRIINNLIKASEFELREDRMPALLKQTREVILEERVVNEENRNTFNSLQIQEEAEKLEWLNHNPNKAKLLYYLEDHPLLNGGISVLGLDHIDYTNRFYSLFDCNKGLVNMALLSIEDYSLKIGWRYQIGSERIDTTWKTLFHTNKDNINKIHDILYQLLKKADEFSDNILFNIVNEYLSSCQEYDWRYYITKYKSMRPEKYGMYYWYDYQTREKSSYRILMMLTEKSISGRNFNIFLIALRDKIRQENPELITRLGEYAYSNDGNKLELTFCNKCVYYTDSEFIIEDIEDSSNIIITDIQQDKVSGKDLEDRVELGYEALKKQGII